MNALFGTELTVLHRLKVEGDIAIGLRLLCLQWFDEAAALQVVVGIARVAPVFAANMPSSTTACLVLDAPRHTAVLATLCSATLAAAQMVGVAVSIGVHPVAVLAFEIRKAGLSFARPPWSNTTTIGAARFAVLVVIAVPAIGRQARVAIFVVPLQQGASLADAMEVVARVEEGDGDIEVLGSMAENRQVVPHFAKDKHLNN